MHILVIDDEPIAHRTWKLVLRGMPVRLSGVTTYQDAERMLETQGRSIDAIILDLRLAPGSGLDLVPKIRAHCPFARVMAVSAYLDAEAMIDAQKVGVMVLPKDRCIRTLRQALSLLTTPDDYGVRALYPGLSDRQVETVEQAMALDNNDRAIAEAMGINPGTVRKHWDRIKTKTGLRRRQMLGALTRRLATGAQAPTGDP